MSKESAPIVGMLRLSSWPAALIGIVLIKAILSLAVKPGSFMVSYSGMSYLLLLILATCFAIRNSIQNTLRGRLFWALLAIAYGLWAAHQALNLYYELGLRVEVPDNSIDDSLLFLHVGVLVAAAATFPHRDVSSRKQNTAVANVLFVTFFWIFVYGYAVFPYQYLFSSGTAFSYALRFDILYLLENLTVILTVGVLAFRVKVPWKSVYFHLFAASTLYALSSTVANLAIDSGGYVNGKLYGLGLTASVCWFLWIPISARQVPSPQVKGAPFDSGQSSQASVWAMIVVVIVSIPIVWELFQRNENSGLRTLRVVFAVVMIVCLASTAYIKEHLAKRELASQAQAALQESEERLRMAVQAGRMFAFSWDAASDTIERSGESTKILGIGDKTPLTGHQVAARVHPEDCENLSSAIAGLSPEKPFLEVCCRIIRTDQDVIWVEGNSLAYFDEHGKILRIVGMVADITGRKLTEQALRESEERFRLVANSAPVMIWVSGVDLVRNYVNKAWLDFRGRSLDEEVGDGWMTGVYPGDLERLLDIEGTAAGRREFYQVEYRVQRRDGEYRWILESGVPRFNTDLSFAGYIGSALDITERKLAEEDKERFLSVFDYSAVGMALVGHDGRWIRVNRALCEILGYSEQELLATNFQSLTHPDDLDADLAYAQRVFAGELRVYHNEKRYIHKQGHVVWVTLTASAVPDASGKVSYGIAQVQDITAKKNAEAALRQDQEELQSLAGRLITIQEEERKRIARDLHDDLSQRLALLSIDLDILRQSLTGNADAARELERMYRETGELLADIRRLSHNEHHPQLALGLQHGVASFCNDFSKQHGIAAKLVPEGDLKRIPETACFTLFRVLQEALSNVAKHSGADRVTVTLGVHGDQAVLRVTDDGRGFEIESDRGLGLISMRERLRLLEGTMRVSSSPLQGTEVEAIVPIPICERAPYAST
jgi:PAS domain S-box-containing protein